MRFTKCGVRVLWFPRLLAENQELQRKCIYSGLLRRYAAEDDDLRRSILTVEKKKSVFITLTLKRNDSMIRHHTTSPKKKQLKTLLSYHKTKGKCRLICRRMHTVPCLAKREEQKMPAPYFQPLQKFVKPCITQHPPRKRSRKHCYHTIRTRECPLR